ncbi:MAG: acyl-CoA dehydrogenase family protein [Phenylobacterium sp.]|nr:acyl-CoA dehydrogenase family protein [Phenylobacterium sp.]
MDFDIPKDIQDYLGELDRFIEDVINPLQRQDDNERFFDHRREHARTDWDNNGLPRKEWEALLAKCRKLADEAGHLRFAWPVEMGGKGGSQLAMAIIREHLAAKGLGLFNDLQTEHSIVGNNPFVLMFKEFATNEQYDRYADKLLNGGMRTGFGLTEPNHGSDATWMETRGVPHEKDGKPGWLINGEKNVDDGHARRHPRDVLRPHQRQGRRRDGHHLLHRPGQCSRSEDRGVYVDVQHADRPPADQLHGRLDSRGQLLGPDRPGPGDRAELRPPEPHPSGGLEPGRGAVLHR